MASKSTQQHQTGTAPDSIGGRLRAAREAAGMNQDVFAAALKSGRSSVSKWELDQRIPDAETIAEACRVLDVPASVLLGLEVESSNEPTHQRLARLVKAEGAKMALEVLEISEAALEAVLQGKLQIPRAAFLRLVRAYGVSQQWLVTGNPTTWTPPLDSGFAARLRYFRICIGFPRESGILEALEREDFVREFLLDQDEPDAKLLGILNVHFGYEWAHDIATLFPWGLEWVVTGKKPQEKPTA
jgi:transcriptional regulator with XRE-family HTH domain